MSTGLLGKKEYARLYINSSGLGLDADLVVNEVFHQLNSRLTMVLSGRSARRVFVFEVRVPLDYVPEETSLQNLEAAFTLLLAQDTVAPEKAPEIQYSIRALSEGFRRQLCIGVSVKLF
jgi:hypothetical protein